VKKQAKIDRGTILKKAVKDSGITITEVARRAGYGRVTYYLHIENSDLKLDILDKYATAIGYDFRDEIPEMVEYYERKRENSLSTFEKIEADRDFWREEYGRILKEKNELLKKIELLEAKLAKK
jgi:transcriptional regulator with XRE-family HTH domain